MKRTLKESVRDIRKMIGRIDHPVIKEGVECTDCDTKELIDKGVMDNEGSVSLLHLDTRNGKSDEIKIKSLLDDHKEEHGGALDAFKHSHIHFDGNHWNFEIPIHNVKLELGGDYSVLKKTSHDTHHGLSSHNVVPHATFQVGLKIPIGKSKKHST